MIKKLFAIPSLLAAGLFASPSSAEDVLPEKTTLADDISELVSSIIDSHKYTLAGHVSHRSHQDHTSHRSHVNHTSHRSGHTSHRSSIQLHPYQSGDENFKNDTIEFSSKLTGTRNIRSTPPKSFLPSSFGVVKKFKVMPGNSKKFKNILLRVQLNLHSLGYDIGAMGTNLDAKTVAAIYKFQKDRGMIPSGKITHEVLGALQIIAQ